MFKEQLATLLDSRMSTLAGIIEEEAKILETTKKIEMKKLQIKIELEKEISAADQATVKTKYSNSEKRRLELEKRLSEDLDTKALTIYKEVTELSLARYEAQEKIQRLQERYLFKQIDIHIAKLEIDKKKEENNG